MRKTVCAISTIVECAVVFFIAIIVIAGSVLAEPMEFVVNGQKRTALVERSPGAEPQPTIIMLHGSGGEAAAIEKESGLSKLAAQEGFVAVFPQAVRGPAGPQWNFFPPDQRADWGATADDAGFLKTLVAELVRLRISDPDRVYLAGFSLGGFMALRMICMETEQFAGVALLATAMPNVLGARCQPTKSVPLFFMLGTADRNVSYEGGPLGQSGLSIWPAVRLLEFFHERNGCDDAGEQSVESMQSRTVEIEHATTCSGAPVVNYRIIEGGHSVPWADIGRSLLLFFSGKLISP